jgi:hypothetical protein
MRKILSILIGLLTVLFIVYTVYTDLDEAQVNDVVEIDGLFVLLEDIRLIEGEDYIYFDDQIHFSVPFIQEFIDQFLLTILEWEDSIQEAKRLR